MGRILQGSINRQEERKTNGKEFLLIPHYKVSKEIHLKIIIIINSVINTFKAVTSSKF